MDLTPNAIMLACATIIANTRTIDAFTARHAEDQRRAAAGWHRRKRARRRRTPQDLTTADANAPPVKANAPPAITA